MTSIALDIVVVVYCVLLALYRPTMEPAYDAALHDTPMPQAIHGAGIVGLIQTTVTVVCSCLLVLFFYR